jgi:hypothetical protein
MQTLSQKLRTEAVLVAKNGITSNLKRTRIAKLMIECADALAGAEADKARLDWLADRENGIGNVQLPTMCVMNNLHSLRDAIDEAMRLDPEIWAVGIKLSINKIY